MTSRYKSFKTYLGSFEATANGVDYTVECGLVKGDRKESSYLFVAIWYGDSYNLVGATFMHRLHIFEYTACLPSILLDMIETKAKQFERLKAFS